MDIKFIDGTTMTTRELAARVRAEGALGVKVLVDLAESGGLRCLLGVAEDAHIVKTSEGAYAVLTKRRVTSWSQIELGVQLRDIRGMAHYNDSIPGTPEERAERVAADLEALPSEGPDDNLCGGEAAGGRATEKRRT